MKTTTTTIILLFLGLFFLTNASYAQAPVAGFSANVTAVCEGGSITFTDASTETISSYSWDFGTGAIPSTATTAGPHNVTWSTAGSKTITLTVTGPGGSDTKSISVSSYANPTANAGSDMNMCDGFNVQLTGSGGGSYAWSPAAGLTDPNISNPTASPSAATTYTLTVTDANGCTDTDDIVVTVNPAPLADAGSDMSICQGGSIQFSGSGGNIYSWSPTTGLNDVTISNPTASPSATTTYTLTVTDANGCTDSDDMTVTVNPQPPASSGIIGPSVICEGSTGIVYSVNNTLGATYNWSVPAGATITNGASTNSITVNFHEGASYGNITVFAISSTGCSDGIPSTLSVSIDTIITADAGPDQTLCATSAALAASDPGAGTGLWTVLSSTASIAAVTNPSTMVNGLSLGANTFRWTVTNGACTTTDDMSIQRITSSSVDAGVDQTLCASTPYVTLNGSGSATSFTWSGGMGFFSNPNSLNTVYYPTAAERAAGGATLRLTGHSLCAPVMDEILIILQAVPSVSAGPDLAVCAGGSIQFSGSGSGLNYQWSPATGLSDATIPNPIATPTTTTTYVLTATASNSCVSRDTLTVFVSMPVPLAISGPTNVCQGRTDAVFTASSSTVAGVTYTWTAPAGATIVSGQGTNSITVEFGLGATSGNIILEVTTPSGCNNGGPSHFAVTVNPMPTITITASASVICAGESAVLNATGSGTPPYYYFWSPNPSVIDFTNDTTVTPASTTSYSVRTTDANGCTSVETNPITITVIPRAANAGPDQFITTTTTTLEGNTPSSGTGTWTLVSGTGIIANPNSPNTAVSGLGTGPNVFRWTVTGATCPGPDDVTIDVGTTSPTTFVSGGTDEVKYDTIYNFSVPYVAGESYEWTVEFTAPFSAEIVSGQHTNNLYVTFDGPTSLKMASGWKIAAANYVISVEIENQYGTKTITRSIGAEAVSGIFDSDKKNFSYKAYPNPFSREIVINVHSASTDDLSLKIMNAQGVVVYTSSGHFTNEDITLIPDLLPGIYEVQAIYNGQLSSFKIVKF